MVKTKKDAYRLLDSVKAAYNLKTYEEAAQHVTDNYKQWDWQGSDRLFLAYCEEILSDRPTHLKN